MKVELKLNPRAEMLKRKGLGDGGAVQKYIDAECLRQMERYTPKLNGVLIEMGTQGTVIGSGKIEYHSPYARYQYYGKLMVSSVTGSAWARSGESKVLTDKDLQYSTHKNPLAGKLWFERMKSAHKDEILKGAQEVVSKRAKRDHK